MVDIGDGKPIQVVCGAPNARAGMKGVFSRARHLHPRQEHHARGRHHPRRRKPRHAVLGGRADDLRRSRRHHRTAGRRAGRQILRRMGRRSSDPVIEINLTPNRPDCTGVNGIARDLGATDDRRLQGSPAQAGEGRVPLPGQGHARLRRDRLAVPGLRPAAGQGRQERPLARLAAEAADGHRPAADQRAGRHHQLHHLRPRPAAACVRRRQGARQSHRAPRAQRRDAARARRQDLHARRRRCA